MKDERKTEIKVGLTVILALLGIFWVIGWAKNVSISSNRKHLSVRIAMVSGLSTGDLVSVNGVKKGFVEEILSEKSTVILRISLDGDVVLKKDAKISVDMLDLMGGKKVEIMQGSSNEDLDFAKVAEGEFSADVPEVMKTVGTMTKELPRMLLSLDSTLSMINKFLTEETSKQTIRTSLEELKQITLKVNDLLDKNGNQITALISNSNQLVSETKEVLRDNKTELSSTLKHANELTQHANRLISEIDSIIVETKGKKNNMGKLLYDDSLTAQVKELTSSLQNMLKVLTDQLSGEGVNVKAKLKIF